MASIWWILGLNFKSCLCGKLSSLHVLIMSDDMICKIIDDMLMSYTTIILSVYFYKVVVFMYNNLGIVSYSMYKLIISNYKFMMI